MTKKINTHLRCCFIANTASGRAAFGMSRTPMLRLHRKRKKVGQNLAVDIKKVTSRKRRLFKSPSKIDRPTVPIR